jgi:ADP-ribose pyrophosphatase YjhB (NUDIX family)
MKNYEKLGEDLKIAWCEDFKLNGELYTQVSGYVFNDQNQILIVRNGATWTVPGGHPEEGETPMQTLDREVMEEACLTVKDAKYIGAVEVVENGQTYYQLRYTARVNEVLPWNEEWEISERKFVDLDDLVNYIKWSKGIVFSEQLECARKYWNI